MYLSFTPPPPKKKKTCDLFFQEYNSIGFNENAALIYQNYFIFDTHISFKSHITEAAMWFFFY